MSEMSNSLTPIAFLSGKTPDDAACFKQSGFQVL